VVTLKNTLAELYIDGKLIESVNIRKRTIPTITEDTKINFGKTLDGYIAGMNRTTSIMSSKTIWENYENDKYELDAYDNKRGYLHNIVYRILHPFSIYQYH
jgi:hypothetical protein